MVEGLPPVLRDPASPVVTPERIRYARASGAFNPAAVVCHRTDRVVLLVRVFEVETRRSSLVLATSEDGARFDVDDRPAVARVAPYEELGVEDARITFLADEERYAITYTGYSSAGPRVCLITTDDILDPGRYERHGPRIEGDNKNAVIFPERIGGRYAFLHRPVPRIHYATVAALEAPWTDPGRPILGPIEGTFRSGRVGAGAPPIRTEAGFLLPFHGATTVAEGNKYSMGWLLLDAADPSRVLHASETPVLAPEAPYEIDPGPLLQVDMANFETGVRVVFPEGMVEREGELLVYYGAADVSVALARVDRASLVAALRGGARG